MQRDCVVQLMKLCVGRWVDINPLHHSRITIYLAARGFCSGAGLFAQRAIASRSRAAAASLYCLLSSKQKARCELHAWRFIGGAS